MSIKDIDEDKELYWDPIATDDGGNYFVQLDVGRDGHVWAIDNQDNVYYREGITSEDKKGTSWSHPDDTKTMRQVAICTNGNVWGVDEENKLWYRGGVTDDNDKGDEWL
jgi:hypothetical protein